MPQFIIGSADSTSGQRCLESEAQAFKFPHDQGIFPDSRPRPSPHPWLAVCFIFGMRKVSALAVLMLAGCNVAGSTQPVPPELEARLQRIPLRDGFTTKREVLLAYGLPSGQFEGERILTYRLEAHPQGACVVTREVDPQDPRLSEWRMASINLILVFDDEHVLQQHAFLQVR